MASKKKAAAKKTAPAKTRAKKVSASDTVTTLEQVFAEKTRSSAPPAIRESAPPPPPPAPSVPLIDTPSMLSLSALMEDGQSAAMWDKRWGALVKVARSGKPATGDEVQAIVSWGRSLGRFSENTLDDHLENAANSAHLGNALIAMLRAGAAREVLSVARQVIDACNERQYDGTFAVSFVSQVFAATTFVDGDIRDEVLEWAITLRCAPDPTVFFNRACALALSGQTERALENVRLARQHGVPAHVFKQDSDFSKLVKHPDFARAIA